jgi:LPXTG-motif cell wall-anchored protein
MPGTGLSGGDLPLLAGLALLVLAAGLALRRNTRAI